MIRIHRGSSPEACPFLMAQKKTKRYTLRLERLAQQCAEEKAARKKMSLNRYIETLILEDCKK